MKCVRSYGGYMSVDRTEALKVNWDRIQRMTLPGSSSHNLHAKYPAQRPSAQEEFPRVRCDKCGSVKEDK